MTTLFFIRHYLVFAAIWALVYAVGRTLLRRIPFANGLQRTVFSSAVGLGVLSLALFFLGLCGELTVPAVTALAVLLVALTARVWPEVFRSLRGMVAAAAACRKRGLAVTATVLTAAVVAVVLPQPLYPPHLFDAVSYHLPYAKTWAMHHAIRPAPNLRFCVLPQLQEVLYAGALLVSDDITAQLTHFLSLALVCLAVFEYARRRFGGTAGVLALACWLTGPSVVVYASSAYIDVALTLFCVTAVLAFEEWRRLNDLRWLALSGVLAGFAASTKYTALFFIAFLGITLLITAARRRDWRPVLLFSLACGLIAAPWYVRNLYYTGNPVFPFLLSVFGNNGKYWTDHDFVNMAAEMHGHGSPRTIVGFLRLPFDLTFNQERFLRTAPYPLTFLVLPVVLVVAFARRIERYLVLVVAAFIVFWFSSAQVFRYLLPIMPLYAILLGALLAWGVHAIAGRAWWRYAITAAVALLIVAPTVLFLLQVRRSMGPVPVTKLQRDLFLQRIRPYRCTQWLNEAYGSNYTLYSYGGEVATYFVDGTHLGDVVGLTGYSRLDTSSSQALYAWLRAHGADLLMSTQYDFFDTVRREPFFQQHFKLVCGCAETRVWQLVDAVVQPVFGRELLASRQSAWTIAGIPPAGEPRGRLVLPPTVSASQSVSVVPGVLYLNVIRAKTSARTPFTIYYRWFDPRGEMVAMDGQPLRADGDALFDIPLTAPATAVRGEITFQNDGPAALPVVVSFRELAYDARSLKSAVVTQVTGTPVEVPEDPPSRGLERAATTEGARFRLRAAGAILEVPAPSGVRADHLDFDVRTDVKGPFALRFISQDERVSQPVYVIPSEQSDGNWVRFLVSIPSEIAPSLSRIRIDPPPEIADGYFELRKIRLR